MFARLSNGWELAKESLGVLRMDKELLVFPLISGISCLLVLASFALPLWQTDYIGEILNDGGQIPSDPVAYVILFAFYAVNYFVIVFFNSALVACAIIRFKGGDPTVGDGLRAATSRLPQILAWSLASATIGVILRTIESYSEKVGAVVSGLLGAAWSIATYFVVPVLVVEQVNPFEAVTRSLSVLKRAWGEALAANFSLGFFQFLLMAILGFVPLAIGGFVAASGHMVPGLILVGCGIGGLILSALIASALNTIVLAALYLYAAEGKVPSHFDNGLLERAFGRN